jgi:hypothetical protein
VKHERAPPERVRLVKQLLDERPRRFHGLGDGATAREMGGDRRRQRAASAMEWPASDSG